MILDPNKYLEYHTPTNVHTAHTTRKTLDRIDSELEHSIPRYTRDISTRPNVVLDAYIHMHVYTPLHPPDV